MFLTWLGTSITLPNTSTSSTITINSMINRTPANNLSILPPFRQLRFPEPSSYYPAIRIVAGPTSMPPSRAKRTKLRAALRLASAGIFVCDRRAIALRIAFLL